jgi:hypothetical protein
MDLIEKNMILKTIDTLINYGEIDATSHTLIGSIHSSLPFTFTVLGDNEQLIPLQNSVDNGSSHIINVNFQFTTGLVSKFELKLEGSEFDINVKLWKPYPISKQVPPHVEVNEPLMDGTVIV